MLPLVSQKNASQIPNQKTEVYYYLYKLETIVMIKEQ